MQKIEHTLWSKQWCDWLTHHSARGAALDLLPPLSTLKESSCIAHPLLPLLVPRAPLLPPPMGMGCSGGDCVSMCSGTGGYTGALSLQVNVQAVPRWPETSEFGSPAGCLSPRAVKKLFLPGLVVGEGKVSARKKKQHGEILTTPLLANGHLGFLESNG